MKKVILFLFFTLFSIYTKAETPALEKYNTPTFRIGTWSGSSFEELVKTKLPKATLVYFKDSMDDLVEAVRNNQIDTFLSDRISAVDLLKQNPDLIIGKDSIDTTKYAMLFNLNNQTLRDEFATEIKKMKASGELQKLQQNWFSDDITLKKTTITPHGKRGLLKVGTTAVDPPFSFYSDNKLVGIEIELVNRIASRLGYSVEWSLVKHSSFIQAIRNKEVDIVAALITITPERQKYVLFGEPDYEDTVVPVIKK